MAQQYPDLPSPVRRTGIFIRTAFQDLLAKIDEPAHASDSSVGSLKQLAAYTVGRYVEQWSSEPDEQEAIYNFVPAHLRKYPLPQVVTTTHD